MPRRRFSAKAGFVVLTLAFVSIIGGLVAASAACVFAVAATPSAADPNDPVALDATCLHDQFGNPVSGATVTFTVQRPLDGSAQAAGTGITDTSGNASAPSWTDTVQYGTYAVVATSGSATASTTFGVAPGAPAGTFSVGSTPANPAAGDSFQLNATGIVDAAMTRPTVTWGADRPFTADLASIDLTQGTGESGTAIRWRMFAPARPGKVRFPELPPDLLPAATPRLRGLGLIDASELPSYDEARTRVRELFVQPPAPGAQLWTSDSRY